MNGEFLRKIIHASGIAVPIIAVIIGKLDTLLVVSGASMVYSASEYLRARGGTLPIIDRITGKALRGAEKSSRFAVAPLLLAVGVSASLLILPTPINYAAIAIVSVGDTTASVAGGVIGKNKIPYNASKSVQGTVVGAAAAFLVCLIFVSPALALTGSVVGMLVESLPVKPSDNFAGRYWLG